MIVLMTNWFLFCLVENGCMLKVIAGNGYQDSLCFYHSYLTAKNNKRDNWGQTVYVVVVMFFEI